MKDPVVAVGLANHAVAEPVGGSRKLNRHIRRLLEAIELTPIMQDLRHDPWLGEAFHEVMKHHPLVVSGYRSACLGKDIGRWCREPCEKITNLVVELQEGEMRLSDEQVLIIAMIAD